MTKTVLLWDRTVLSHIFVAVTCHSVAHTLALFWTPLESEGCSLTLNPPLIISWIPNKSEGK